MAAVAKKIMVGYDGSDSARRALDRAAELAGYGSVVTVVNVGGAGRGRALLAEARARLLRRQIRAMYVEPAGDPTEALIDKARELDADMVVVGRSGPNGSPSGNVVHDAPCDVLVVR